MVKHNSAEYHVKLSIGKWKCFRHSTLKEDLNACLCGLFFRSCKHFNRGINSVHDTGSSDSLLRSNGERPRPATYIKHGFAVRYAAQIQHFLAKSILLS